MGRRHEPQEALGRAIRQLRDERGLKQKELAHAADVNGTAISHLEHGRVNPSWGTVKRIAVWFSPQNSEHTPGHSPASVMLMSMALSTRGMRSRFSMKLGTQNECTTSGDERSRRTVRPTGSTSTGSFPGTPVSTTGLPS